MEFYQLQSFLTVAREGNLTKAAGLLHLSQSALSNQIKSLEGEVGTDLFQRMPRGMELSFAGRKLLSHAETAVRAMEDFGTAARGLGDNLSGRLSVGLNTDPSFLRIADLDSRMGAKFPLVDLEFLPSQTLATTSLLNGEVLDVGFRFGKSGDNGICEEWIADSRFPFMHCYPVTNRERCFKNQLLHIIFSFCCRKSVEFIFLLK
ncbi:LysR family transcriptional regulator [Desulfovibrio gilichinskyi]|uniref:Regulatory helix-turn-helix protein, lysR family n=1 Tax=Desulfovibrio gilichinskyi TaxID=1519643 RepID=A0A1X7DYH1_9BACT|nr:LysR family transcriptional regulator [Desulfovibrio gilichinskyi]SMF23678.1 regulatory helix-turn-helix protein, lysR family [Desulfovibrio gilichinskyi]